MLRPGSFALTVLLALVTAGCLAPLVWFFTRRARNS
jgi:hypothetical protein